mgnify:CR=1 FL=1
MIGKRDLVEIETEWNLKQGIPEHLLLPKRVEIQTYFNLKSVSVGIVCLDYWVEIETEWNLKRFIAVKAGLEEPRRNRNRVEFKE